MKSKKIFYVILMVVAVTILFGSMFIPESEEIRYSPPVLSRAEEIEEWAPETPIPGKVDLEEVWPTVTPTP